jgi:glycerol uptake facilitator-like aquaporin
MAETLTKDAGLALLGNTLPTGAILVVLITIFGPISGAHFNPAVSLVFALKRDLGPQETSLYVAAQIVGGVAGKFAAHLMFGLPVLETSLKARTGGAQWFAEWVATFGLVVTILAGLHQPNHQLTHERRVGSGAATGVGASASGIATGPGAAITVGAISARRSACACQASRARCNS